MTRMHRPTLLMMSSRPRVALFLLLIGSGGLAGCVTPLFPEDAPRTQYEAYDLMRGRYTPLEEPDVFGNPQPALRARLGQR